MRTNDRFEDFDTLRSLQTNLCAPAAPRTPLANRKLPMALGRASAIRAFKARAQCAV